MSIVVGLGEDTGTTLVPWPSGFWVISMTLCTLIQLKTFRFYHEKLNKRKCTYTTIVDVISSDLHTHHFYSLSYIRTWFSAEKKEPASAPHFWRHIYQSQSRTSRIFLEYSTSYTLELKTLPFNYVYLRRLRGTRHSLAVPLSIDFEECARVARGQCLPYTHPSHNISLFATDWRYFVPVHGAFNNGHISQSFLI
jgi:hypothetical protein